MRSRKYGVNLYDLRLRKKDGKPYWRYHSGHHRTSWSEDKADRLARELASKMGVSVEGDSGDACIPEVEIDNLQAIVEYAQLVRVRHPDLSEHKSLRVASIRYSKGGRPSTKPQSLVAAVAAFEEIAAEELQIAEEKGKRTKAKNAEVLEYCPACPKDVAKVVAKKAMQSGMPVSHYGRLDRYMTAKNKVT